MIAPLSFSLVAAFAPAVAVSFSVDASVAMVAPQDFASGKGSSSMSGGTPEPTSVLLLAGGAVAYGAYRMKRARDQQKQER